MVNRILTTHAGNLPRPTDLDEMIAIRDASAWRSRLPSAVREVVQRQIDYGIDIINDGEYVKACSTSATPYSYLGYIDERVTGWEAVPIDGGRPLKRAISAARDQRDFPGFHASGLWHSGSGGPTRPGFATPGAPPAPTTERVCTGPVRYVGQKSIDFDISAFKEALPAGVAGFIAALGPLSLGAGARNSYYRTEADYMTAVAEVMRQEYKSITDAGIIVQVDEPEFATAWMFYPDWTIDQYRSYLETCVEIINYSIRGLPEELVRFHTCWGSGHRPHTNDIEMKYIADLLVKINAGSYSIEAGNVRHSHEWKVWADTTIPDGKTLVAGVISHATDLVEHPELVAERLVNFASVVGRGNLQAGTDCGIGSRVGHAEVAWAKLRSLAEGAALASKVLWRRG